MPFSYLLSVIALCLFTFSSVTFSKENRFFEEFDKQYSAVKERCVELTKIPYPASDNPLPSQLLSLKKCDAINLYYGIEHTADYAQARLCALSIRDDDMNAGVLMMLYANGQSVKQNYTLAKKAACEFGGAQAELVARMKHLDAMQSGIKKNSLKIDLCDDITSGMMQGVCASIDSKLQDQTRNTRLAQITNGWNAQEKSAFLTLQIAARKYFTLTSENEVDLSGTAGSAFSIAEEKSQKEDFFKSIIEFEAGKLPKFTQNDFAKSDHELNDAYHQLKELPEPIGETINMEGVKQVQRAWLEYRDAWVAFGKVKYPIVSDFAWKTYFTKKRLILLNELIKSW